MEACPGLMILKLIGRLTGDCAATIDLPLVSEWGRWEGRDKTGTSLEVDIVAPLLEGGMLTGAIKWTDAPMTAAVYFRHLDMLRRAAAAGQKWAHEALEPDSPLLYASAAGFHVRFRHVTDQTGQPVILLDLEDMYSPVLG